jgi:hypothetical protein
MIENDYNKNVNLIIISCQPARQGKMTVKQRVIQKRSEKR